ncbi:MAG: iron-only hydrogenase system regulator [Desulfovibrio sp.]|nr:iron-only hydrogenase system regulator [Desulfovibrio sp.]
METRVAIIAIIVSSPESVSQVNDLLHTYSDAIIGRMGLPYRQKGINIISVVLDCPQDTASALAGKIGKLPGVSTQTLYSK